MQELDLFRKLELITEGGNVFKDATKTPVTQRISKDEIKPSVAFVEEILGIPLDGYLGTTGKKDTSGDIDISVDSSKYDKKEIANKLKVWAKEQGQRPGEWVKLSGTNVHFKTPIRDVSGKHKGGFAQLDLMFGDPHFQQWAMRGESGKYKGVHRHIIMANIAKANGMKWSYLNGLVNRNTNEVISQDPEQIASTLLPGASVNNFASVESILSYLYKNFNGADLEKYIGEAYETLEKHYNVTLPKPGTMQESVQMREEPEQYFLARLRDRVLMQEYSVLINESTIFEASARINHLEDLVMFEGPKGLLKSIDILKHFAAGEGHSQTTLKWDGSPAIVFGRDETGQFILTDKSGFSAKGYDGKAKSRQELKQMFVNRKPPMDASRKKFIGNMMDIFDEYEKATPPEFRGYMKGDLMYYNTPPVTNGAYVIKPNIVQYEVNPKSEIGQRIGASKTGVVVHQYIGDMYQSTEEAIDTMQGTEVFVIPPVTVQEPVKINTAPIDKMAAFAKKHSAGFAELFNPSNLKGMSDFPNMLYSYINNKVDTGLDNLGSDFLEWLNTKKLTDRKRENVTNYVQENQESLNALWKVVSGVMKMKDALVQKFDSQASNVKQSINGQSGGEGYVINYNGELVKLVPRHTFSAANRAAH